MKIIKFFLFLIVTFFYSNIIIASENFAYVDMAKLLNDSDAGKSLTIQLTKIHKQNIVNLEKIATNLKKDEKEILAKKNILSKEEFEMKLSELRLKAKDYNNERKAKNDLLNKKRNDARKNLLQLINPILTDYANQNSISMIFEKKNIIMGKTNLDITNKILITLNSKIKKIEIN